MLMVEGRRVLRDDQDCVLVNPKGRTSQWDVRGKD